MSNFDLVVDDLSGNIAYLSNDYTSFKVFFEREDGDVYVHREADVMAILYTDGTEKRDFVASDFT